MAAIKVLIVDDSALVRQVLTEILNSDADIEVVATANDPYAARDKIKRLNPDVLTLDVEMPRMDGLTFLRNLMRLRPMPVVMVSTLTEQGADVTFEALEIGAIDFVAKPKIDLANTIGDYAAEIIAKVKMAAGSRVVARADAPSRKEPPRTQPPTAVKLPEVEKRNSADAVLERKEPAKHFRSTDQLLAIGASTGGTEAIREVLEALPANTPGTVITQHIPAAFSGPFAARMDRCSQLTVCEAIDGQQILPGHAYIAPGDKHLMVRRDGARFICELNDGPLVNRHKPSVDVLFRSVAQNIGPNAIAALLTGMGNDGAAGLLEIQQAGAPTLAQDENTSVVWGMPGEAVKLGAADQVLPLGRIGEHLVSLFRTP